MTAPTANEKGGSPFLSFRALLWLVVFGLCLVRLSQAWSVQDFVRLVLYSACLWFPLAIIVHELGHAFGARVIGATVLRIKLGLSVSPVGQHLSFRFLGFPWELYSLPMGGSVRYLHPSEPKFFKRKVAFVTAAGPLATLFASCVGYFCYLLSPPGCIAPLFLGWCLANAVLFVSTLLPITAKGGDGKPLPYDGLRIWRLLFMPEHEVLQNCFQAAIRKEFAIGKGREWLDDIPLPELIARYDADADKLGSLLVLIDRLGAAKDPRQNDYVAKLLAHPLASPATLQKFLDGYITHHLDDDTVRGNPLFDQFSEQLMNVSGHSITTRGTRGSVLIDLGRLEEGRALLLDVLAKTGSNVDKTYSNIFLALAEKQLGNLELARFYAATAAKLTPDCPPLKRIADLLEPSERLS
jgi:hypothetical protein